MRFAVVAGLSMLALIGAARGQEPGLAEKLLHNKDLLSNPPASCAADASLNNFQLQQCAALGFRDADAELNRTYQVALSASSGAAVEKLKQAQRLWIAFRDAECEWEAARYEGGTLAPVVFGNCLGIITRDRSKQLRSALEP